MGDPEVYPDEWDDRSATGCPAGGRWAVGREVHRRSDESRPLGAGKSDIHSFGRIQEGCPGVPRFDVITLRVTNPQCILFATFNGPECGMGSKPSVIKMWVVLPPGSGTAPR